MEILHAGISRFCQYWPDAQMLQQTYSSLITELASENDGSIDAAKAIVECACQIIISQLDDPNNPIKQWNNSPIKSSTPTINNWVTAATNLLNLSEKRNDPFSKIVSQHNKLAKELGEFRNAAGPLSHGRDGFSKKLSAHHRKAAVLSADAMVAFLHEAYLEHQSNSIISSEPFTHFSDLSTIIDKHCIFDAATIKDDRLFVKIAYPNKVIIELDLNLSELLFHFDRSAFQAALNLCDGFEGDREADIQ